MSGVAGIVRAARKPMRLRTLTNALAVVLLLLGFGVVALWARSHVGRFAHAIEYSPEKGSRWRLVSHRGRVWLETWRRPDPVAMLNLSTTEERLSAESRRLFGWYREHRDDANTMLAGRPAPAAMMEQYRHYQAVGAELRRVQRRLQAENRAAMRPRFQTRPVPHALPAGALAAAAAVSALPMLVVRLRGRHRARAGLCPGCGYDVRANSARCSECGHEASKPVN